jgi:hypothetical protein
VDIDLDITAAQVLDTEVAELRGGYLNSRIPKEMIEELTTFAYFLSGKRRQAAPGAKNITRGDAVVRLLRAAMASVYANEGLPSSPTRAEIDAKLKSQKKSRLS